jgi:hypothetical protein
MKGASEKPIGEERRTVRAWGDGRQQDTETAYADRDEIFWNVERNISAD